jgi:phospholipid transport system substrate-binding protein
MSRRGLLIGAAAALGAGVAPALALDVGQARTLIDKAVADVNAIIASGKSEAAMFKDFERLFVKYADVPVIARSALGPAARTVSAGELSAFTKAFQGYISRKYGRRFREFIGGRIEVTDAKPLKSYFEVISIAYLKGESPFEVRWHVSDKAGKPLFFNLIIEGVNMLSSERAEIGAMLDRRRGDIGALVADLNAA